MYPTPERSWDMTVISLPEGLTAFQGLGYKPHPSSAVIKSPVSSHQIPPLYAVPKPVRVTGKLHECTLNLTCECPWRVLSAWNILFPVHLAYAHPSSSYLTTQHLHWIIFSEPDNSSSLLICKMCWLQYLSHGFIYGVSVSHFRLFLDP